MAGEDQELEPQAPGAPEPEAPSEKTYGEEYVKKLRVESARHRLENKELKQRLEELEAAMSEQKPAATPPPAPAVPPEVEQALRTLAGEVDSLKAELQRRDQAIQKLAIADELGLPRPLAERLRGETPEALREDAQALLEVLRAAAQPAASARSQTTAVPGGQTPTESFDAIYNRLIYGSAASRMSELPKPGPIVPTTLVFGGDET